MTADTSRQSRPNIIVILVDDMGYSDIGCFGSEIRTPNLDSMARGGMVFTQMYNCARCCPTRASLLTGLYPHQAGVGHMVGDYGVPAYQGYLRKDAVTIAEALKTGGYRTYLSGKWHVGGGYRANEPENWRPGADDHPIPVQRGFDHHYGFLAGATSYFNPHTLIRDDTLIEPEDDCYFTDTISENACRFIDDAQQHAQPFFLYTAYTAPHWPLHALPEDIARYEGTYRDGWGELRGRRHEALKTSGLLDESWPLSPGDEKAPDFGSLDPARREWEDLRMAVYAAMIDRMDQGVGRILATLRRHGIEDDTIVMFLSDNGGCAEFLAEDGHCEQYSCLTRTNEPVRIGNHPELRPGPATTFMSYDLPWANASNSPFRLYKSYIHEGGSSTPLLVHWSRGIRPGVTHTPCHVVDILPTCLDVAGVDYPEQYDGNAIQPTEGESFASALAGENWRRERPIFFEHQGNRGVRDGRWKLVSRHPGPWELYDMQADRTELNDLAARDPKRLAAMEQTYRQWADRCGVLDWKQVHELRKR